MNDLIAVITASPLRQRLIDDMTLRKFSHETQRNYLRDVGRFATWLRRSPHTATAEDLRQFQIEHQEAGVPAPTMNSIVAALRKDNLERARHLLAVAPPPVDDVTAAPQPTLRPCPCCGGHMIIIEIVESRYQSRAPPAFASSPGRSAS